MQPEEAICKICGKPFIKRVGNQDMCSAKCAKQRMKQYTRKDNTALNLFLREVEAHYPSDILRNDKLERPCLYCGKVFKPYTVVKDKNGIHGRGRFFCSIQCCEAYQK